jgi:hypothetical protein
MTAFAMCVGLHDWRRQRCNEGACGMSMEPMHQCTVVYSECEIQMHLPCVVAGCGTIHSRGWQPSKSYQALTTAASGGAVVLGCANGSTHCTIRNIAQLQCSCAVACAEDLCLCSFPGIACRLSHDARDLKCSQGAGPQIAACNAAALLEKHTTPASPRFVARWLLIVHN